MKQVILKRIEELQSSLESLEDASKAVQPSISIGRLTRMDAIGSQKVNEHILSQNRTAMLTLENALNRIEKGTYGQCVRCAKEIPIGRLRHVPEALMCVPCAEDHSRRRN